MPMRSAQCSWESALPCMPWITVHTAHAHIHTHSCSHIHARTHAHVLKYMQGRSMASLAGVTCVQPFTLTSVLQNYMTYDVAMDR